jgi:hypothetical protein
MLESNFGKIFLFAMMAVSCHSFVPSGRVVISPPMIESKVFSNVSVKQSYKNVVRHMSDSTSTEADVPEPENKGLVDKVSENQIKSIET